MIPLLTDALFGSLAVTIMGGSYRNAHYFAVYSYLYAIFFNIKLEKSDKIVMNNMNRLKIRYKSLLVALSF